MTRSTRRIRSTRRGSTILYSSICLVALCGVISLGVDFGRVQVARSQLQTASDTAARYAASGVKHEIGGVNAAQGMARAVLAENRVDANYVAASQATVDVGVWDTVAHKFTPNANVAVANAVRVVLRASEADGSAVPLLFGRIIGRDHQDLSVTSIALYDADKYLSMSGNSGSGKNTNYESKYVPATSNLWLAGDVKGKGASKNNPHNNPDAAGDSANPLQSPVEMTNVRLNVGSTITFDGINGNANNDINDPARYTADGNLKQIVNNLEGAENGKSNVTTPINAVIAVFLDDKEPKDGDAPEALDFSTAASRDFHTLNPKLNQTFFVGDGRSGNGDLQQFVVPKGAKRLFVGTMDSYEWNNNVGGFTVTATSAAKVVLVR